MNFKEILDMTLQFIESYHIWIVLCLVVLALVLFVSLLVSMKHTKVERKNSAALLNKSVIAEENFNKEMDKLNAIITNKENTIIAKESVIANKEETIQNLQSSKELDKTEYLEKVKSLEERENELSTALVEKEKELESEVTKSKEVMEEYASLKENHSKASNELKSLKATLADANAKYEAELNALTEAKGLLAEEYSKFQIESAERLNALKEELKSQKDINAALVVAVQEVGSKKEKEPVVTPAPETAKTDKIENLRRDEILAVAKSIGIEGCYKMKKDEIIEAINKKLNKEKTSKPKKK